MLFSPDSVFRCKFSEVAFDVYECGCGLPFQKPIYLLKVSFVALFLQKVFLMLSVRFLRRCVFQVVSVTNALKLRLI
ncbi:hypothetical protein CGJ22_22730 [Vibrio parahaemolyticus]|nr:hypothetical protein CGJ22_22730 [Vibrio parahaemolyticus]